MGWLNYQNHCITSRCAIPFTRPEAVWHKVTEETASCGEALTMLMCNTTLKDDDHRVDKPENSRRGIAYITALTSLVGITAAVLNALCLVVILKKRLHWENNRFIFMAMLTFADMIMSFGKPSLCYHGSYIWNNLPNSIKLHTFKSLISTWDGPKCKCVACRSTT